MEKLWSSATFVGLTRPPMFMGVTIDYLSLCGMITLSLFILSNSLFYLTIYFPLHLTGWIACQIDPHIFRLLSKQWECPNTSNKSLWGCQSYDPM